jgi:outer membrane lipoprotein-sorting protein
MDTKITAKVVIILLVTVGTCWAGCCIKSLDSKREEKEAKPDPVETVLKQLNQKTKQLKSYESRVEYEVNQPLFETKTLRKGVLYYARFDKKKSKLRINFQTLKQDDEKEQKYIEQFIFDGVWLTHIDYQIKTHRYHQLADPNEHKDANEPRDAFDLVSRNFPIIGFAKIKDLKKQFEIKLLEPRKGDPENSIHLHLKVKPDSVYKDDYTTIDFWIDKKLGLPIKVAAVTTEEDICRLKLLKPKVNKRIDKKVFEFKIPRGFGKPEIIPLKKKTK